MGQSVIAGGTGQVLLNQSRDTAHSAWDRFLLTSPAGQFQQSGLWAGVKAASGWRVLRTVLSNGEGIIGGFQILWRRAGPLRVAYVSKGPVLAREDQETAEAMADLLIKTAEEHRITALVVQPPDCSRLLDAALDHRGFIREKALDVIQATLLVDVRQGIAEVEGRMRRTTRRECRWARSAGVTLREGEEGDLSTFFRLMQLTCRRQKETPNPPSLKALTAIWRAFSECGRAGSARLMLAEYQGKAVAGLLCLNFGERVSLWKKGADPDFMELHPFSLLLHDALHWASENGYQACDFCRLSGENARAILGGLPLTDRQRRSRDFFNLGFGGRPLLLPPPVILVRHPFLRLVCRLLFGKAHAHAQAPATRLARSLLRGWRARLGVRRA